MGGASRRDRVYCVGLAELAQWYKRTEGRQGLGASKAKSAASFVLPGVLAHVLYGLLEVAAAG